MFARRANRWVPLNEIEDGINRVMETVLGGTGVNLPFGRTGPAVNAWEDAGALHFEAEVPGLGLDDLEVEVIGQELHLRGRRRAPDQSEVTFHREERPTGDFQRTLNLPVEVDAENTSAQLKDGVLHITLPKTESSKGRRIDVNGA